MDTRIGYPNEHLAGDSDAETTSPMYATAVGLGLNSLESKGKSSLMTKFPPKEIEEEERQEPGKEVEKEIKKEEKEPKDRKRFFDKWAEKFKEFLDNAE